MLRKWNRSFNFISRQDIARLIPRHILDSLTAVSLLHGTRVLDVGSGAGLPGLVLAIADPQRQFVLCDRSERRMRFCEQVIQDLALDNVTVWVGDLSPDHAPEGSFDTVVSRAVATAAEVWDMVRNLLAADGRVLVYASTQSAALPQIGHLNVTRHDFDIQGVDHPHTLLCMCRDTEAE